MAVCLVITGCQLQPEYQKPVAKAPAAWNQKYLQSTHSAASETSSAFFSDQTLKAIIDLALKNNVDIKTAVLNLKKAEALYGIQRLALMPAVNATLGMTAAHEPAGLLDTIDTGAITYHQYDVKMVSASWELDFWGRVRSLKDAALYDYFASDANVQALKLTIIGQSVSCYLTFLADKNALFLSEKKQANAAAMLSVYRGAYKLGDISRENLIDYENAFSSAQQETAAIREKVQKDYDALQLVLGGKLPDQKTEDFSFEREWDIGDMNPNIPARVLEKRPDVIAAEYRLRQANADIGAARAAFFPSITLTAEGGTSSAELKDLFSAGTATWGFSPGISIPIFNNGRNRANLQAAEISQQIAANDYSKTVQQAFRDVSDALAGVEAKKKTYTESARILENQHKKLAMVKMSIQAGATDKVSYLKAENDLLDARKEKINNQLQLLLQRVQLYQTLGGSINI